jgi:hypothetical protein
VIVRGRSRGGAGNLARHLLRTDTNERVEILQTFGTGAQDLSGALKEMAALADGSRCKNPLYHASLAPAPGERLTPEQWEIAADRLGEEFGMSGNARAIVLHTKKGEQHAHVVYCRIDPESMTAAHDGHNYAKNEAVARDLERRFGLERVQGVFAERERDSPRPERTPELWEMQQGRHTEIDPRDFRREARDLHSASDNGRAFAAALAERNVTLCRGDRRDFVLLDEAGGVHSLSRTLGLKAAEVRAFMADIERDGLPTVAQARAEIERANAPEIAPEIAAYRAAAEAATEDRRNFPDPAEAREVWQPKAEPTRAEKVRQRRAEAADAIGQAWREAEREPVEFVIALGQRGLTLAEDDKGRFVALDGEGDAHFLSARALGEPAKEAQAHMHDGLHGEGVTVLSVAEARAALKEERKAAWIQARKEERRAAYIQKQRDRTADNDLVRGMNAAYLRHPDNTGFADALAEDGVVLGRVSEAEAGRMAEARDLAKEIKASHVPAAHEAGTMFAVAPDGRSYLLDATTLYDSDAAIKERFAGYDPGLTWSEAKAAQREARKIERQAESYERRAEAAAKREAAYASRTGNAYPAEWDTLRQLGEAYAVSDSGAELVAELEKRDLLLVRVTGEEAEASRHRHEAQASLGRYAPAYEEGQYLAIDKSGQAWTLDRSTIYDDADAIAAKLATINPDEQPTLTQGREVMAFWRTQETEEPRGFAHEGADAGPGLAILGNSAGRALGFVLQSLGDVLDYFIGHQPPGHAPPPRARQPEAGPSVQEQRRQTLRTSGETATHDPNIEALARTMNVDADIAAAYLRRIREAEREREDRERDR